MGGRGCGRACTHSRGEKGCLPDRCRSPQVGQVPMHLAVARGHQAVVKTLLAEGTFKDAKDQVRGEDAGRG